MKLNAAQLAAMATGATPEIIASLAHAPEANPPGNPAADAGAPAPAGAAGGESGAAAPATGASTPTAPPAAAAGEGIGVAAPVVAADTAVIDHLKAELATKDAALIAAKVEVESFKAQAASVEGMVAAMRTVVGEKLVALGASADAAAGITAANAVSEFTRIDGIFKSQFRVGGVTAVTKPEVKPEATIDPLMAARMKHSIAR